MARNIILILLALGFLASAFQLSRYYYFRDAFGLRTASHRRNPPNFAAKVFTDENLEGAFLPYANFRNANLNEILMRGANLQFADFTGADLNNAGVGDSNFSGAIFHQANLRNVRWLDSAVFRNASFRNTDLSWVSFHGMGGQHRRSAPKHLLDPTYGGADLTGATFEGATCEHTIFSRCLLAGANFKNAKCQEADFSDADLRNADFTGADLRLAKLDGADTTGAIFTNAKR
jgi:uncharacterized protein YjbI with pentapeptide repeats